MRVGVLVEVADLILEIKLDQIEGLLDHASSDIVDDFVLEPAVPILLLLDAVLLLHELLDELERVKAGLDDVPRSHPISDLLIVSEGIVSFFGALSKH